MPAKPLKVEGIDVLDTALRMSDPEAKKMELLRLYALGYYYGKHGADRPMSARVEATWKYWRDEIPKYLTTI